MIYDVPCIKNSPLVKQVGLDNVDDITKNRNFYHIMTDLDDNFIIENETDLNDALECLDFHMVNDLPYEILDFVDNNPDVLFEKFKNTLYYDTLNFIKNISYAKKFKYLNNTYESTDKNWSYVTFDKYILEYLIDRGYPDRQYDFKQCYCMHYIIQDNFELLKFAHDNIPKDDLRVIHDHYDFQWHEHIDEPCQYAAKNGNLEMMKYMYDLCKRWDNKTIIAAAEQGHLHCLKYAIENGCRYDNGAMAIHAANYACKNGHLECLKYLIKKDGVVCVNECKKYAKENNQTHILDFINKYWNEDEYRFRIKW